MPKRPPQEAPAAALLDALRAVPLPSLAAALVGLFAAFAADFSLRPDSAALANLYLLPIASAAWYCGPALGLVIAAIASILGATAGGFGDGLLGHVIMPTLVYMAAAWVVGALRGAYDYERELARTDAVTGMPNRRSFDERARATIRRHARSRRPLTAACIDLDGFKAVNDLRGHAEGDRVLRAVADTLVRSVRSSDIVARWGGDEFALLLPDTDERGAALLLARLRGALHTAMEEEGWAVTFSVGAVTWRVMPRNERDLMQPVDARMYEAKKGGKDKLIHETRGAVLSA